MSPLIHPLSHFSVLMFLIASFRFCLILCDDRKKKNKDKNQNLADMANSTMGYLYFQGTTSEIGSTVVEGLTNKSKLILGIVKNTQNIISVQSTFSATTVKQNMHVFAKFQRLIFPVRFVVTSGCLPHFRPNLSKHAAASVICICSLFHSANCFQFL